MRTRQVLVAVLVALAVGYAVTTTGRSTVTAVGVGILAFALIRLAFATIGRTRHWLSRGTRGAYSTNCPDCGQYIYRQSGDWILRCYRCGWTAGWPLVRWLTQSVPSKQLQRSISLPTIVIVFVGALLFASGVGAVPGFDVGSVASQPASAGDADRSATATPEPTPTPTTTPVESGINPARVEEMFIQYLNEERQSRDLQTLEQRDELTEMGTAHSENMARYDYIGHEEPDGTTMIDRYEQRGLSCRMPIEGSDRYYAGAENANAVYLGDYRTTYGETLYIDSEEDIARVLFREWMHSEPHKEAMLVESADQAGLGIAVNENGKLFASLELC